MNGLIFRVLVSFSIWALIAGVRLPAFAAGLEADMVIFNGKILTADSPDPDNFRTAQAAAIYDGKFVVVGNNDEALALAGASTRRIDLGGRTVIPGLVETHQHINRSSYAGHFVPKGAPMVDSTVPAPTWTNKDDFLAQIRTLALSKKPGEWIISTVRGGVGGGMVIELQKGEVTRFDLDKVSPNNPVHLHWNVSVEGLLNSKALDPLLARYPKIVGVIRDARGVPTGRVEGVANYTMLFEFWPLIPAQELGSYYRQEMEEQAAAGLTSISTRLLPNDVAAVSSVGAMKQLPTRIAFSLEAAARSETTEAIMRRLTGLQGGQGKAIWGLGSDLMWMVGISPISIDSTPGVAGSCVRKPFPREAPEFPLWLHQFYGPTGLCRLQDPSYHDIDVLRMAAQNGFRISGMHVSGDKAVDQFLDLVEELSKQYPAIAGQRWAADHCQMIREEQVVRAKTLGIMFSCAPTFLYGGARGAVGAFKYIYGEEEAGDSVIPFRRFVRHGVRGVMELDSHGFYPFLALEIAVTRKDNTGKVWGPNQKINRREALYTYTRWSSEYLLKEDVIGTIEPRKAADFVVLDRDYLAVPDEDISEINPLLTVMGGRITYSQPQFAASLGMQPAGFQQDPTWWQRGRAGARPAGN